MHLAAKCDSPCAFWHVDNMDVLFWATAYLRESYGKFGNLNLQKSWGGNFAYKTDTKNGEISLEVVIFSAQFFSGNEMHLDPSGAGRRSEDFTCTISELLGEFWTDVFAWARSNFDSQDGHVSLFSLL